MISESTTNSVSMSADGSSASSSTLSELPDVLREVKEEYSGDREMPLGGYVVTMSTYASMVAALTGVALATGKRPPERIEPFDFALVALATHKLSRVITKDSVTSPLRAPFTRFTGVSGPAELNEEVRHKGGLRHSIGELLTCPFCMGMWVSTGFSFGMIFAPRGTRLAAATLAALAGSDFLHFAYAKTYQSVS